jgi:hypothetical protein
MLLDRVKELVNLDLEIENVNFQPDTDTDSYTSGEIRFFKDENTYLECEAHVEVRYYKIQKVVKRKVLIGAVKVDGVELYLNQSQENELIELIKKECL